MTGNSELEGLVQLYADGEMSADDARDFEDRMAAEPDIAAQVAEVMTQSDRLRAEIPNPPPDRLLRLMAAAERAVSDRRTGWRRLAASLALVAIGGVGGYGLALFQGVEAPLYTGSVTELAADAADAHALYAAEVRHPVEVTAVERDHLAGWLTNRLGAEISAPELRPLGYNLVGGRLLPFEWRGAAQFMYEDTGGERVTLFAVTADSPAQTAFRFRDEKDLTAITWQEGIWRYALVGAVSRDEMERMARYIHGERI